MKPDLWDLLVAVGLLLIGIGIVDLLGIVALWFYVGIVLLMVGAAGATRGKR